MRRVAVAVATLLAAAVALTVATRVGAQVLPIPNPLATTTTPPAAPATTTPPGTSTSVAETTSSTDAPTEASLPADTIPLITDTSEPLTVAGAPPASAPRRATPRVVALPAGIRSASVTGAYGIGFGGVVAVALLLIAFTTVTRSHLLPGGTAMNPRRRARLIAGFGCLALAAIVGLVGYLKLSLEPDVNRQIPYLASAGMALVLLAAVGGAFIVGEQMRTDEQRIEELEAAVQQLASIVAPTVEAAPRTRARTRA
jgi:hypothetical protein